MRLSKFTNRSDRFISWIGGNLSLVEDLKRSLMKLWPRGYYRIAKLKQLITPLRFDRYFDGADESLQVPERCIVELLPYVPSHIDRILIIGCASGRDFIPFQKTHKLWGIDIAPYERINWRCDTSKLTYNQCWAERLPSLIRDEDLTHTLVYSSGTLMYVPSRHQQRLYQALLARGCRNFIFQEPTRWHAQFGIDTANLCFQLPYNDFQQIIFRKGPDEPITFVRLEDVALPRFESV
jgi:hypothetical protein